MNLCITHQQIYNDYCVYCGAPKPDWVSKMVPGAANVPLGTTSSGEPKPSPDRQYEAPDPASSGRFCKGCGNELPRRRGRAPKLCDDCGTGSARPYEGRSHQRLHKEMEQRSKESTASILQNHPPKVFPKSAPKSEVGTPTYKVPES